MFHPIIIAYGMFTAFIARKFDLIADFRGYSAAESSFSEQRIDGFFFGPTLFFGYFREISCSTTFVVMIIDKFDTNSMNSNLLGMFEKLRQK